jgi:ABC-type multidrug transport system permease subunit
MTRTPRLFAVTALVVTPLAFLVTLLVSWSAGGVNAAVIAAVPAIFAALFFGGLTFLAAVVERDEASVQAPAVSGFGSRQRAA